MSIAIPIVTLTQTIQAPVEQVYRSFTERDWIRDWFCDSAYIEARVGGPFVFSWYTQYFAMGTFTALEENQKIAFTWRGAGETEDSQIEILLDAEGNTTTVTLHHSQASGNLEAFQSEWEMRLGYLKAALETGADARITDRVIVGFIPGQVSAERAQEIGLAEGEGTLVTSVVEGYSAEAAGIQRGDVIVEVAGHKITPDFPAGNISQGRKPGDTVDVVYYRGTEKHTASVELKGYPVPEAYENFPALADALHEEFAGYITEIRNLFEGVSEEKANAKPADGEWSANENLAHLILSQQWISHWVGGLIQGPETEGFTGNSDARLQGVLTIYPSTAALLEAFEKSCHETVAIVRHFPDELTGRKTNLWWTAFEMVGSNHHLRGHIEQIRDVLA